MCILLYKAVKYATLNKITMLNFKVSTKMHIYE